MEIRTPPPLLMWSTVLLLRRVVGSDPADELTETTPATDAGRLHSSSLPAGTGSETSRDLLGYISSLVAVAGSLLVSAALLWMLTPVQAARRAGVSPSLIYQLCAERRLAHFRIGGGGRRGKLLIGEEDLDAFLASCRVTDEPQMDESDLRHIR